MDFPAGQIRGPRSDWRKKLALETMRLAENRMARRRAACEAMAEVEHFTGIMGMNDIQEARFPLPA